MLTPEQFERRKNFVGSSDAAPHFAGFLGRAGLAVLRWAYGAVSRGTRAISQDRVSSRLQGLWSEVQPVPA